ncbi:hypothetical protein MSG28_014682 [Choristoneura fumiferana]|uniref:Uncharacterized protein n=1 Tax=Choristoneura fumiferana TaxID=7141 RepID=A0ACC0JS70_CHOFU|nr:hypothetical protein MSG28_014682 [Choristoneura fumiferana]
MKEILKHEILEFHPDTLIRVREACGLDAPGRMEEAVGLLRDWAAKQEHFLKKDFGEEELEVDEELEADNPSSANPICT